MKRHFSITISALIAGDDALGQAMLHDMGTEARFVRHGDG
jgi:hypothetical protein